MDFLKRPWKWLRSQHPVVILRAIAVACLNCFPCTGPRRDQERRQHVPVLIGKPQIALLLILDGEQTLDPIRIMKGLFLFSMETPEHLLAPYERYDFIPYSFGPYSYDIDRDLDRLVEHGYVKISKKAGKSWNYYYLSEKGKREAQELASEMPPQAIAYLRKVRTFVLSVSFTKLLDTIYAKYPGFATKSRYKR
jgi:hypothetical protein